MTCYQQQGLWVGADVSRSWSGQGRQPQTCLIQKAVKGSFLFLHSKYKQHVMIKREWLVLPWEEA